MMFGTVRLSSRYCGKHELEKKNLEEPTSVV